MNAQEWQEEVEYCVNLVKSGGNDSVGHAKRTVLSYLAMQMDAATREGFRSTALTLYGLIVRIKANRYKFTA